MLLQSQDIAIRYEISGPASAPALLFSHSLGVNLQMWRPQLEALSRHYRIVLYDTRGHGASSAGVEPSVTGTLSIESLGKDVLNLLDALAIEQAHFCGLSMGGVIGQWLGAYAPQRLRTLVLANTAAKIGTAESWNTRIATVEREGLAAVIPATLERWFTSEFRNRNPQTIAGVEAMLRSTSAAGYLSCCAAIRDADFRSTTHRIAVPTLVIAGKHDPVTSCDDMRWLAGAISGSKYVELDAAHLSSIEAAGAFNDALHAFLRTRG